MARPRFSEMLEERRRQLGLSIEQASRVLKLKEQVLIAFEEGDFDNIPKSGYAQGMLSSYARYLGLNPRTVVDQFQEDLYEYSNGVSSHELRRRTREGRGDTSAMDALAEIAARRTEQTPRTLLRSDPRENSHSEYFDTTTPVRTRSQSWQQSSGASSAAGEQQTEVRSTPLSQRAYARSLRTGSSPNAVPRARVDASRYESEDIVRRELPSNYSDDLSIVTEARPYESAASAQGRRAMRARTASRAQHPNVRRGDSAARNQIRGRERRTTEHDGILGVIEAYFSNPTRVLATAIVIVGLLLTLIIISSVRSCASSHVSEDRQVGVTTAATSSEQAQEGADEQTDEEKAAAQAAAEEAARKRAEAEAAAAAAKEPAVVVSIPDGLVSWIEINLDGVYQVSETITGPWEQNYTVKDSIDILAGDITVVSVTQDGSPVQFEMRSSGIGGIYIEGPGAKQATSDAASQDGASDATDSTDATSTSEGEADAATTDGTAEGDTTQQDGDYAG